MSEKLLQQILSELTGIKSEITGINNELATINNEITIIKSNQATIKAQLEENTQLTKAIFNRQEESDAKLESLSMDIHKIHGDLSSLKGEMRDIKNEVTFTYQKTSKNELDIFKLQQIHEQ
ncbi:hypothetical protein [Psychrobacillus sp. NPDC096389]|uniref:hypothetical protein n=1 Tax=Psychrobacillus sp. NPDC096389 TaxID=3364490 RepID=UPI00382B3699